MLISRENIKKLQAVKSEENKEIIDEIVNYFNTWAGVGYNTDDLVYLPKGLIEKLESLNLKGCEMQERNEIKTCWVCGLDLSEETVGVGTFIFRNFGSKERIYHLCSLCRNVIYNDMKRDRKTLRKTHQKTLIYDN